MTDTLINPALVQDSYIPGKHVYKPTMWALGYIAKFTKTRACGVCGRTHTVSMQGRVPIGPVTCQEETSEDHS